MRIAYLGTFQFPEGDAGAARVLGVGRTLRACGHEVTFFGIEKNGDSNAAVKTKGESIFSSFEGFNYVSPGPTKFNFRAKIARQISVFSGSTILHRLTDASDFYGPFDVVIAYQPTSLLLFRLKLWCKDNCISLICDAVEWYDPRQLFGGKLGLFYWDSELRMRYVQKKVDGVLAISTFLEKYYSSSGLRTVVVPPTLDVQQIEIEPASSKIDMRFLTLLYAGNPGKKDLLAHIIRGVDYVDPSGTSLRLMILGPTAEQVMELTGSNDLPRSVEVLGRVSKAKINQYIQQADFSVLLRSYERFTEAGFPTKFVESMANGTPVIANITSDIGCYLQDGYNGLVCDDSSTESFVCTLKRALSLTEKQKKDMRIAARNQAEKSFHYMNYKDALSAFVNEVSAKHDVL